MSEMSEIPRVCLPAVSVEGGGEDEQNGQRLLDVEGLSRYLSLPRSTIYTWRSTRQLPPRAIVKLGRALRFDRAEIDRWVDGLQVSRR